MAIPRDAPRRIDLHEQVRQSASVEDPLAQSPIALVVLA